jgi:hypothetical protein
MLEFDVLYNKEYGQAWEDSKTSDNNKVNVLLH